jgi:cytochrome bd ubiquinol oxidase subunit II
LQGFARRSLWIGTPVFVGLATVTCVASILVQPRVQDAWTSRTAILLLIAAIFIAVGGALIASIERGPAIRPFLFGLVLFACDLLGLGIVIFPNIVPFQLSLWDAASATSSQVFMLVGAAVVTPIVLAYSAFAYHVFHGRAPEQGWNS